jgi:hypothetical protein
MSPTASRRFFLALASLVFVAPPSRAVAESAPPPLRRDIGAFALYGRTHVKLNGASAMPHRGATGSDALVEFSLRTPADGAESYVAAPILAARESTRIHFAYANSLDVTDGVIFLHTPKPLPLPLVAAIDFPRLPAIDCDEANDVFVDRFVSPLTLAPGRYGQITVDQGQTLKLVPGGRYEVCTVRVRAGATVEAGPGNLVLIRDFLTTDAHSRITGAGACGARWVAAGQKTSPAPNASAFAFMHRDGPADRSLVEGDFLTPGRIAMGQNLDYKGRFWADRIEGLGVEPIARTVSDCLAPRCGDGVLHAGEGCDDGNNLDGDCCSALCEVLPAGASCNDGRFCTATDACDASARCVGSGDPCDAPDGDANCSEACDEDADSCTAPDPDGSTCDDGLWCNGRDLCAAGRCEAHQDLPCAGPDDDANCRESCHEPTRTCNAPDPVGAACNDGRFCTVGESCDSAGSCSGGFPRCLGPDGDDNCAESCDELADICTAADPEGSPCSDGLFCTAVDRCDGRGTCLGIGDPCGGAIGDGDGDCSEACDEASGSCGASDPDGAPCDDGLACTVEERCLGGICVPGGRTTCDDSTPCTDEFCAPDGRCLREYNAIACDDGNPCTTGDRCLRGVCTGTGEIDCRDDDLCSTDLCDPADGTCRHSYAPADHCRAAGRSSMQIRKSYGDAGEPESSLAAVWTGRRGDPSAREDLGDPSAGDAFAVCFYDESSGLPELSYRLDLDATTLEGAAWKRKSNFFKLVYRLAAKAGTSQGVAQVRLGIDSDGVPTFRMRAGVGPGCKGPCRSKFQPPAARPDGRLFAMEPGMTVQWTSTTGACWSTRFREAKKNSGEAFQVRSASR